MTLLIALLTQFYIQSHLDDWSSEERQILVAAATPYARCINEHVPEYLSLTRRDARSEGELNARVERVGAAFDACRSQLSESIERARSELPRQLTNIRPNLRDNAIGLFFARLQDSYTYPVMLGAPPQLMVPFPEQESN